MAGAFLRTFFEGLDIKCSLAAYALLNDRDGEGYGMEKKRLLVRPIMLGLATAMGAYLVLLTLAAYLTVSGRLDEVRIGQAVWACACLSAFGGAMMTLRGKRGVAALPLLAAAAFWVCVSLIGLLASDAPDLNGVLGLLAASALGGLLAAGLARRRLFSFTAGSWVVGMIDQTVDAGFIKGLVPDGKHKDRKTAHSARRERIAQIWPGGE